MRCSLMPCFFGILSKYAMFFALFCRDFLQYLVHMCPSTKSFIHSFVLDIYVPPALVNPAGNVDMKFWTLLDADSLLSSSMMFCDPSAPSSHLRSVTYFPLDEAAAESETHSLTLIHILRMEKIF